MHARGCTAAQNAGASGTTDAVIVLDFGGQTFQSGWGTLDIITGAFRSDNQIYVAAKNFGKGYYDCKPNSSYKLGLSIGTNNSLTQTNPSGADWGTLVKTVDDWLVANAPGVRGYGGNDIEPGFGGFGDAAGWADGYSGSSSRPYMDFGSADGCPTSGRGWNSSCNNGWTTGKVYTVAWGHRLALALPEIYATSGVNASQWKNISNAAIDDRKTAISFTGTLTEWKSCQQVGCPQTISNAPSSGWNQLETLIGQPTLRSTDIAHW
jgi:hypothetical protein